MNSLGEPARNDSKGCGGVMRVAPVGLFAWRLRRAAEPLIPLDLFGNRVVRRGTVAAEMAEVVPPQVAAALRHALHC